MSTFKITVKRSRRMMLSALGCLTLISMIGCSPRFVTVNADEMVSVKKGELDTLHSDNELLLQALKECQEK